MKKYPELQEYWERLETFKEAHNISLSMKISAQTGENVDQMFTEVAGIILKRFKFRRKYELS